METQTQPPTKNTQNHQSQFGTFHALLYLSSFKNKKTNTLNHQEITYKSPQTQPNTTQNNNQTKNKT
jgi:hypothetical protein